MGMTYTIIETNSQMVARAINGEELDHTEFGETVATCKRLLHPTYTIVFVRRDRNKVVQTLARQPCFFLWHPLTSLLSG
ncbi:hypothetical protein LINPERHAP2_LOCUS39686 [Linum perenne]